MCNIAGYIGPREAAKVLCEMMAKESGFAGGYYTGLATVENGKLFYDKVLGDVDLFVSEAHGDCLPGHIGIGHSRSKSGGDVHWGHPFVSNDGKLSYIANGSGGKLAKLIDRDGAAGEMSRKGYIFETACDRIIGTYPRLPDGRCVHGSEVMCHLIRDNMLSRSMNCAEAMMAAFAEKPSEIVGLSLTSDEPDTISFARYNMPCMIARTEDEVFIASTAICFPKDRNYISITSIPVCSWGTISLKETVVHRFRPGIYVADADPAVISKVYTLIPEVLREAGKPLSVGNLGKLTKDAWAGYEDCVIPCTHVIYEALRQLLKEDRIEIIEKDEPGADEGLDRNIRAKRFYVNLK